MFIKLYNSWYDLNKDKSQSINELISIFEKKGNSNLYACVSESTENFSSIELMKFSFAMYNFVPCLTFLPEVLLDM